MKHISSDNVLQFVTDVLQRMGVFGKLIQCTMPILSSIPSPCIIMDLWEAVLLFWDEDIAFQVHIKWSTEHSGRDQIGTAEDWGSYLSFCTHKLIHNPIVHPVFTTSVYFFVFCLFIQIFIDFYPLSGEEFNKYSSSSHSKYPLMECTHVLSPMMPGICGIDEDLYKQLFAFQ